MEKITIEELQRLKKIEALHVELLAACRAALVVFDLEAEVNRQDASEYLRKVIRKAEGLK